MNATPQGRATLVQLRSFEAVARLGGVGKAAQALHLAQPTVSTQPRVLSESVGLRLFEPEGRGLRLTEEGELLLQAARDVFERWRRFEEEAAALRGLASGRLRVAAVTTAEYFLPALAVAVRTHVPVYVARSVMDSAGIVPEEDLQEESAPKAITAKESDVEGGEERLSVFQDFLEKLDLNSLDSKGNEEDSEEE